MDLNEILVFAKVVQSGSFIGASRDLGMPKSTVSRKISELEERLGARLLHRTTRKLRLTDVGHAFYQHAERVVAEAEEAKLVVSRMQEVPRGLLRVTAPLSFGYLSPIVASFLQRYPEVQLELVCADRVVDLIQEGFDIAVRAGNLTDSTLIARNLGVLRSYLVASPAFLAKKGTPEAPQELEHFDCVVFGGGADRSRWRLHAKGTTATIDVRARFVVNDFDFLDEAALSGIGVAMLPVFRCIEHLRAKRLTRVLPEWCSPDTPLHAVYPSARHLSPKVKAFLDHVRERMTPPPWEIAPAP
ncbi:MAG: LysR family transcriptional regulator [Deltaproteobacteria bacterium]|nr:LysR family transcriptional regulator [Deltaproteobacteria bacterium]